MCQLYSVITGAHTILCSTDPEADRHFIRDVLKFPYIDIGHGWLIFALPQSELAVHPSENQAYHEMYLVCDNIQAFVQEMQQQQVNCTGVDEQRWGSLVYITLPGGSKLGVYQPKHARPNG